MARHDASLCHKHPKLLEFSALILESQPLADAAGMRIRLDKSHFFPAGGGQPADKGKINGIQIRNVYEENGQIWHSLDQDPGSGPVECVIDPDWRRHFMRQHTGQHIISGAFWRVARIQTVSVHLGEEITTIETDKAEIKDEIIARVENLANEIITQNLPVSYIDTHSDKAAQYPLRKPPSISGPMRLVSIHSFDCSVCCGLHLHASAETGLVKCLGTEKIRSRIRTNWLIGTPAFSDYQVKHRIISALRTVLSCSVEELHPKTLRMIEENKRQKRELTSLESRLSAELVNRLLGSDVKTMNGVRTVTAILRESESLVSGSVKSLLAEKALLFCIVNLANDHFSWAIGCSSDICFDFDAVRESLLTTVSGKGGGRSPLWKGVSPQAAKAQEFIDSFLSLATQCKGI